MRALILAERPQGCAQRMRDAGFVPEVAEEIAFYLDQANDLDAEADALIGALDSKGIDARIADPTEGGAWIGWLMERPAETVVWPITDGIRYYRGSGAMAAAQLFGARTFGSSIQAHGLAQDKMKTAAVARALGVPVPRSGVLRGGRWLTPAPTGEGPWFVKPNTLGAKIGIWPDSRVATLDGAIDLSRRIFDRYHDDAVVQPFIPGSDVRVSYMAVRPDPDLQKVGAYRLDTSLRTGFVTLADSRNLVGQPDRNGRPHGGQGLTAHLIDLAETDPQTHHRMAGMLRTLADGFGLADVFSMDIRLADDGTPWLLEVEVCPAVTIFDFKRYLADRWTCNLPEAIASAFLGRLDPAAIL